MKRVTFNDDAPLPPHGAAPMLEGPKVRTDYSCAAQGCPNAASIDDDMARGGPRGRCYWHWKASPETWPAVTARIRANFEEMRNHGGTMPRSPYAQTVSDRNARRRHVDMGDAE